jgi:3-deoxy-D-manno-octulosonate 8-phosphate phosphatase (KDO 8-P phosphatase)
MTNNMKPKHFILDVDGVFSDGKFYYSERGKVMKRYGPDDNDGLSLLKGRLEVRTITGDKRGFRITKRRMDDMKLPVSLVSTYERVQWIEERCDLGEVIYMGDGIYDALVFQKVGYSIAPANAFYTTKMMANFVTNARGGEGAVAEACIHILERYFEPFDINRIDFQNASGAWEKKPMS